MGLFSKKDKQLNSEFSEKQAISGGNLYNIDQLLTSQQQIDFNDLRNLTNQFTNMNMTNINFDDDVISPYWLFELQTNYFINTIKFDLDDLELKEKVILMLRIAFKNGVGAIYFEGDKVMVGGINNIKKNFYGEIVDCDFRPINEELIINLSQDDYLKCLKYKIKDYKNLFIFKWGSAAISGWVTIYRLCQIQYKLLKMIQTDSYSYIKKIVYKVNDPKTQIQDIKEYFNVNSPFFMIPKGVDLKNRFDFNEAFNVSQPNILIEYYKQTMGIYYSMYGRRTNNDYKKERSITQEIGLTSDNYETLELDWINQFKIFCFKLKKEKNIKIDVEENKSMTESDLMKTKVEEGELNE